MDKLPIREDFLLAPEDVEFVCTKSTGAGGQYVNCTDSSVQLRYPLDRIPLDMRSRIKGNISSGGVLLIEAQQHRSQLQNKELAYRHLAEILERAARPPKERRPTKPTKASRMKRLLSKRIKSRKKQLRRGNPDDE